MFVVPASVFAATKVTGKPTLTIEVKSFEIENKTIADGDGPQGHVVLFSGWIDMRLLVTHADGLRNQKMMPAIQGKEVGRRGFYWAGTNDELVFVRSGNTLQVQRETQDEMSDKPNAREPLFTTYLPAAVTIKMK